MARAIDLASALGGMSLSGQQWNKLDRLAEINTILQTRLDRPTFDLIVESQTLALEIIEEEYERHARA